MNVLNIYTYSRSDNAFISNQVEIKEGDECNICFHSFKNGTQKTVQTTCPQPHMNHASCLKRWLNTSIFNTKISTCPACRSEIGGIREALNKIPTDSTSEQKNSAAKAMLIEGRKNFQDAQSDVFWLQPAIKALQFAHDNGEREATQLLSKAMLIQGRKNFQDAQSDVFWLQPAIKALQFAHDNGEREATQLLSKAMLIQGRKNFQDAQSNVFWLQPAIKVLQFAHDNGEREATQLLSKAMLIQGRKNFQDAQSNVFWLQPAIKVLQFAHDNGDEETKAQAIPLLHASRKLTKVVPDDCAFGAAPEPSVCAGHGT